MFRMIVFGFGIPIWASCVSGTLLPSISTCSLFREAATHNSSIGSHGLVCVYHNMSPNVAMSTECGSNVTIAYELHGHTHS